MCIKKKTKSQRLNEKSQWSINDLKYMVDNHPESFPRINTETRDKGRNERYKSIPLYDSVKSIVEHMKIGDTYLNAAGTRCYIIEISDELISYGFDRYSIYSKITKMDMYDCIKMGLIKF